MLVEKQSGFLAGQELLITGGEKETAVLCDNPRSFFARGEQCQVPATIR
jgi:hypothetical protein